MKRTLSRREWIQQMGMMVFLSGVGCQSVAPRSASAETEAAAIRIDPDASGSVPLNSLAWGVNAPGRELDWLNNKVIQARIREAGIYLVRVGAVQQAIHSGKDPYPRSGVWDFTVLDRAVETIQQAGAEPIFLACQFPAGVPHTLDTGDHKTIRSADWKEYGRFMAGVVRRYNKERHTGKPIRYWELWNEPTIEGDGTFPSKAEYARFIHAVGGAMKAVDPSIRLIGPADAWSDLGPEGYLAYTAKHLAEEIDVLCWHDYGPGEDTVPSDQKRLAWPVKHYEDQVHEVVSGGNGRFVGPSGKRFGAALTEYNWTTASGKTEEYNARFHDDYNVVYTASAIVHALRGGIELFCFFTLAQAGANYLSLLTNTDFAPRKPYPVFELFGKHLYRGASDRIIAPSEALPESLEWLIVRGGSDSYRVLVINKEQSVSRPVRIQVAEKGSRVKNVRRTRILPDGSIATTAVSIPTDSILRDTLPPLSVQVFEFLTGV